MKDKDQKLLWEAYEGGDLRDTWKKTEVAEKIKEIHGWDVEADPESGKWYRLDAPGGPRPVTGDEHWDIMRIEDPEKEAEYKRKLGESETSDKISGQRWSEEGGGYDRNSDLYQVVSDLKPLLDEFYKNDYDPEDHDEVSRKLFAVIELLGGQSVLSRWQDRAKDAGHKFGANAEAEYDAMDIDDPHHWQNSGARPPGY